MSVLHLCTLQNSTQGCHLIMRIGQALTGGLTSLRIVNTVRASTRNSAAMVQQQRPKIVVDVISDTVCPWCYVGKRRLEKAMEALKDRADFEVHWLPYQLNPTAPQEGINKLQYYRDKFGARADMIIPQMTQTFAELGLKYSIGGLTGNTFNSHRLIHWAGQQKGWEVQNQLVDALFDAYFCQEKYINDKQVLLEAAKKVGLDVNAAAAYLDDPSAGAAEVNAELDKGWRRRVSGVPNFTLNSQFVLSGAQPPETFKEAFEQLLAEGGAGAPNARAAQGC